MYMNFRVEMQPENVRCRADKQFGIGLGAVLFFWGGVLIAKGVIIGYLLGIAGFSFLFLAVIFPVSLRFAHAMCARLGATAGMIITAIILAGFYYCVVTPLAVCAKLSGRCFMRIGYRKDCTTYWDVQNEAVTKQNDYTRQY